MDYSGLSHIAEHYGLEHQIGKLREELVELFEVAFDISLNPQSLDQRLFELVDEMADVKIMISQIEVLTGTIQNVADRMDFKVRRQLDRMRRGVERG